MELVAALMPGEPNPLEWALRREAEGWFGVSLGDHIAPGGRSYPHLWVTLTQFALGTTSLHLASTFANNLVRGAISTGSSTT